MSEQITEDAEIKQETDIKSSVDSTEAKTELKEDHLIPENKQRID